VLYRPTVVTANGFGNLFRQFGFALVLAAANCTQAPKQKTEPPPEALEGTYYSDDDQGVLVFRSDGTFGYKFAAHLAVVYNEGNLPPDRGSYVLLPDGAVKVTGDLGAEVPFALQVSKDKSMIVLTRATAGPESYGLGLPAKAKYTKKPVGEP
jgi:hypothetical protein